jgi:UPF0755 protein
MNEKIISVNHKRKRNIIAFFSIFSTVILLATTGGLYIYNKIYKANVYLNNNQKEIFLYIKTGSNYNKVVEQIEEMNILKDINSFKILAEKKKYPQNVKSGKYRITNGMSNNELINMLRSGRQHPVRLTFNNIRLKQQLISRIANQIEADSLSLAEAFSNSEIYEKWGFNSENIMTMFLPNTYEFFWNTSVVDLFERMNNEYNKFWNEERLSKAEKMNLSPIQVIILASIVYQETKKIDEMSKIAGVYMNRLKINMPLQADPTVVFALGNFSVNRVLKHHLEIESPYNTYKIIGLPPGPICLPDLITIDKTLDYEKHDYLFFCAKDDLSGYHAFAKTHAQHIQNAARYHVALNKNKIRS